MNEERDYGAEQTELAEGEYRMGIMTTDELIEKIKEWGRNKGIDNPDKQLMKCYEEINEITREFVRGRHRTLGVVDAIGDTAVTLIILADILGYDFTECLREAYDVIAIRTGVTIDGSFVKKEDIDGEAS